MIPNRNINDEMGVFEQLKPLYGVAIDKLWIAYKASNPRQRTELLQRLELLAIRVQRKRIGDRKIYIEPPKPDVIGAGDYNIGNVLFPGKAPYAFTLHRRELLRHVL